MNGKSMVFLQAERVIFLSTWEKGGSNILDMLEFYELWFEENATTQSNWKERDEDTNEDSEGLPIEKAVNDRPVNLPRWQKGGRNERI